MCGRARSAVARAAHPLLAPPPPAPPLAPSTPRPVRSIVRAAPPACAQRPPTLICAPPGHGDKRAARSAVGIGGAVRHRWRGGGGGRVRFTWEHVLHPLALTRTVCGSARARHARARGETGAFSEVVRAPVPLCTHTAGA
eukprot:3042825-Prymnesium_polylepis.1